MKIYNILQKLFAREQGGRELRERKVAEGAISSRKSLCSQSQLKHSPLTTPYTLSSRTTHHPTTNYQLPTTNYRSMQHYKKL
ncbi:hypothetical protein IQ272_26260 [Chroococcidiopsidales cyanobacterium LEGE 13417]|nr:hypothetical protein [Chroococcidiopsidales cyanobacterium LEGE 13417]